MTLHRYAAGCALALVLAATGCGVGEPGEAEPLPGPTEQTSGSTPTLTRTPSAPAPSPSPSPSPSPGGPAYSTWRLGSQVLPEGADGFGEVRPTPPSLRMRRYATTDLLPPPRGGRFASTIGPITPAIRTRMGETWAPGCPVPLEGLRYVTVSFRGFDGAAHTGELVLAAEYAQPVVSVFEELYTVDFPIEEMRLVTTADLDAPPTGDGNNTAALVCRPTVGQTSGWSEHAYGRAVDINPFHNPYQKGDLVLPELASAYLDRGRRLPGMIHPDGVVVRAFARIGWSWGGDYNSLKDYHHFSATGR